jgi:hypothetical protein
MRFALEQTFAGSVEDVLATFTDPDFIATLGELPKLDAPELLDQATEGAVVRQRVRYRFVGSLSPAVTRVLDPSRLVWVDETTYDTAAGTASFRILPEHYGNRLTCSGTYRFVEAEGGHGAVRHTAAELRVSYPIVGRAVERAIVSGLSDHLRDEGDLVDRWLAGTIGP